MEESKKEGKMTFGSIWWNVIRMTAFVGAGAVTGAIFLSACLFFNKVWTHVNQPHSETHIEKWVDKEFNKCKFEKDGCLIENGATMKFSAGENLAENKDGRK